MRTTFFIRKLTPTWSLIGLLLIGLTQTSPAQTLSDIERDAIARDATEKRHYVRSRLVIRRVKPHWYTAQTLQPWPHQPTGAVALQK